LSVDIESVVFSFLAKVTAFMALFCLSFLMFNPNQGRSIVILYSVITLIIALILYVLGKRNTIRK